MSSETEKTDGGSANHAAYRRSFLRHVHRLLQLGYESLTPTAYTTAEEDDITGDICKHMKVLTEERPSEPWMARYAIHDQDPVNDVINPTTSKVRKGKRRPKLDIRLVSKARVPNAQFCVEAKRLYRSDSVSAYLDHEGLGAFVGEYYAQYDGAAGMLGYVQEGSLNDWLTKIDNGLSQDASLRRDGNRKVWRLSSFSGGPTCTYRSEHDRKSGGPRIEVFHTFFVFN